MKKLISAFLLISVIISVFTFSVSAVAEDEQTSGKVPDGATDTLDMFDYLLIKAIYFGTYAPNEDEAARSDVNADGNIDMFDYLAVKRAYFLGETVLPSVDNWDKTPREIDFDSHSLEGYIEEFEMDAFIPQKADGDELPSFLITDQENLDELLTIVSEDLYDNFREFVADIPTKEFFEEHAMLVAYVAAGSGSDRISIEKVFIDENGITMTVGFSNAYVGTADMQYRLMTAVVKKSDIGSCTIFNSVLHILPTTVYFQENILSGYVPSLKDEISDTSLPSRVIKNRAELDEFLALCEDGYGSEFADFAQTIDESYFEHSALFVAFGMSQAWGDIVTIDSVCFDDEKLYMNVSLYQVGVDDGIKSFVLAAKIDNIFLTENLQPQVNLNIYDELPEPTT